LQRLALQTREWFSVVTAGLAGNGVSGILPGGVAAGAGLQFEMLSNAGFGSGAAAAALTAFSLLEVGALLALPVVALPAVLAGLLILAGVHGGDAFLATLAYRLASYWLPLSTGLPAYLLYRHRYGRLAHHARH
jgi:hypothetical protein